MFIGAGTEYKYFSIPLEQGLKHLDLSNKSTIKMLHCN